MVEQYKDTPEISTVIVNETGTWYQWLLTATERAHIGSLLGFDASTLTLKGNIMNRERSVCSCGKHSGLDDIVDNALSLGIHKADFMIDVLQNGPKGESPAHEVSCSNCGVKHGNSFFWVDQGDWRD